MRDLKNTGKEEDESRGKQAFNKIMYYVATWIVVALILWIYWMLANDPIITY